MAVFILLRNIVLAAPFTSAATEAVRTSVDDGLAIISMAASTAFVIGTEGTAALFCNGTGETAASKRSRVEGYTCRW